MKNFLYIFGFAFIALIFQTTAIPSLFSSLGHSMHWETFAHVTINITFLILLYICFTRNFITAIYWMFAFILMQNSFDVPWKGALALSYIFLLIIIYILETMFAFQYSLSTMLIIFLLIVSQNFFHLWMGSLAVGFDDPLNGEMGNIVLGGAVTALVAPIIFYGLYLIDRETIFYFDRSKSFFGRRVGL